MTEYNETTNFDELDHSDDWPDATVREDDMVPDEEGLKYLAELEKKLTDLYDELEKEGGLQ